MVGAGEAKVFMSNKDALIRAFMVGATFGLAAVFAITVAVKIRFTTSWRRLISSRLYHALPNEV
jgi:formate/nitrite transporter FocA (FNT family)